MKVLMSLLMAIMFLGGQAVAEEENICDGQIGAAYGLCTAYHSMGCDSSEPDAAAASCARISALFEKLTGFPPPSETPAVCPLWTTENLDDTYECGSYPCISVNNDVTEHNTGQYTYYYDECDGPWGQYKLLQVERYDDGTIEGWYYEEGIEGQDIHDLRMPLSVAQAAACEADISTFTFCLDVDCPLWTPEQLAQTYGSSYDCDICTNDSAYYDPTTAVNVLEDTCEGPWGRDVLLSVGRYDDGSIIGQYIEDGFETQPIHDITRTLTQDEADECEADITSHTFSCNAD